jgi:hypothetical protein
MPDKNQLREQLKRKLDLSIRGVVKAQQLDEAADQIIRAGKADRPLLEAVGKAVFGDREIFANTDIDDVMDILNQIKGS